MIKNKLPQLIVAVVMIMTTILSYADIPTIYQAGTLINLTNGIYDGTMTLADLTSHGTLGLGTIAGAKGEMVILDGKAYLGMAGRTAETIPSSNKTPFAMVVDFQPSMHFSLSNIHSLDELEKQIDAKIPSPNIFYAIKITGDFTEIDMRDFQAPTKPYVPLDQWIKQRQVIYHIRQTSGTLVAFRSPNYINPISVAGYHFHYINQLHTQVGHVYNLQFAQAEVSIEPVYRFDLLLPDTEGFMKKPLQLISNESVQKIERNK